MTDAKPPRILADSTKKKYEQTLGVLDKAGVPWKTDATATLKHFADQKLSNSAVKVNLSAIKYSLGAEDYPKVYQEKMNELQGIQRARDDEQMLNEKQVENFVTYEELLKQQQRLGAKEDKSERDWKDYVVASLYTLNPPVRADYGDMRIYKIRPGRKARTGNELIWGKKRAFFIFRTYKTSATYGAVEVPVSPALYEVLASWFAYVGKVPKYLLGRAIEAHDLLNYVERAFKPSGKRIGIDLLRHAYIHAHLPAISTDIKAKQALARQMLHSVDRQAHYFPKNV